MAYLSLFTFFMLMLVTADNFVQLFFGWEGVGLCSYLLIGFWYDRPAANAAAIKAFIVNRVGDFGFVLGILGVYLVFKNVGFDAVFKAAPGMQADQHRFPRHASADHGYALPAAVHRRHGQIGAARLLHTWLPDAMEGPTPVSALIHAATMVTAGVFMVCAAVADVRIRADGAGRGHGGRRRDGVLRRHRRPGAERHQARHRLFDLQPARLHVLRRRRLGLWRAPCSI